MATIKLPQNSFTAGAIDYLRMRGRIDLKQYYNAAETLENVLIHPQGGVYRRPGTLFLQNYTAQTYLRLEVFEYSENIKYLLVFYNDNIDVWKDDVNIFTITTTGLTDTQLMEMDIVQSANSMIICHEDFSPQELVRGVDDVTWTLSPIVFTALPLFGFNLSVSNPAATLTPSAISSSITLTAGSAAFAATDEGGYVTGNGGEARITKYISTTVVEATVLVPFVDTSAIPSGQWELETGYEVAWSGSRGYPRCAVYHEDRLGFGGTPSLPDVVWFSAIGDVFNFDDTRAFKNDALTFNLRGDKLSEIRFMLSMDDLVIYTSSSEHYVDGVLTAELDFRVKRQDRRGTRENVKPVFVDGVGMFADARADIVREFAYNDLDGKYNTPNLNLLSSDVLSSIVGMEHLQPKGSRSADNVYCINADGSWAVLNTLRKQEITGWTTGKSRSDSLKGVINLDGEMYCWFERSINGSTERYLEKFSEDETMDCVKKYSGVATDTITGMDHLEGETVGVVVEGKIHENEVVTGGSITLDDEYTEVSVGLKFTPKIILLPPNRELPDGTMLGRIRKLNALNLGVSNTFGMIVDEIPVEFRKFGDPIFDVPPPEFNGRKRVTLRGYKREPMPVITQDEQLGFHLTDVAMEVRV